jgi:hypothetical protein
MQNTKKLERDNVCIQFFSSVLHLRGDQIAVQPYEHDGNILCWNGEVECFMDPLRSLIDIHGIRYSKAWISPLQRTMGSGSFNNYAVAKMSRPPLPR